jgi:hypothetical protein
MPCLFFIVLFIVVYRSTQRVNELVYPQTVTTDYIEPRLIESDSIKRSSNDKFWWQFGLIVGFLGGVSGLLIGLYNSGRFVTFF